MKRNVIIGFFILSLFALAMYLILNDETGRIARLVEAKTNEKVLSVELGEDGFFVKTDKCYYQVVFKNTKNEIEITARLPYFNEQESSELLKRFNEEVESEEETDY